MKLRYEVLTHVSYDFENTWTMLNKKGREVKQLFRTKTEAREALREHLVDAKEAGLDYEQCDLRIAAVKPKLKGTPCT